MLNCITKQPEVASFKRNRSNDEYYYFASLVDLVSCSVRQNSIICGIAVPKSYFLQ